MFKALIVALLITILASLALGMVFLIRDGGKTRRPVRALTVRIGLSLLVFALLFVGYFTGALQPHGIYPPPSDVRTGSDQSQ
jgi:hypothetical protein